MDASILIWIISLPFIVGVITLLIPEKVRGVREALSLAATIACFIMSILIFAGRELVFVRDWIPQLGINFSLRAYPLSSFILIFIYLFGLLTSFYSLRFMWGKKRLREYYAYILFTVGASAGAVLSNNLIIFLIFWGVTLLMLYGLLSFGKSKVAAKGLYTIGVSDFCLLLGIVFIWQITGTFNMSNIYRIPLTGSLALSAFILMMVGGIAKAGSIPFHTWITDASKETPASIMAFLPASLDKLLGIYLLYRICIDFFGLVPNSGLTVLLMGIGSFTIIVAIMMALVQTEIGRSIAYLNVSAAGYLLIGLATSNSTGIIGALFYLLSTGLWTACLFFCSGAVKQLTNTTEFSALGGLTRRLPITFATFLIAGLAISGVPPLNGFYAKWLVYQGIIESGMVGVGGARNLWILWLVVAVFGSALTLAAFMRIMHGTFVGEPRSAAVRGKKRRGESFSMATSEIILAGLCVVFGIFATRIPIRAFLLPALGERVSFAGFWSPGLATLLIVIGIVVGAIIYGVSRVRVPREDMAFVGGELTTPGMRVSGGEWYDTVTEHRGLKGVYARASKGTYNFYNWGAGFFKVVPYVVYTFGDRLVDYLWRGISSIGLGISRRMGRTHTGVLSFYILWIVIGIIILLLVLLR